MAVGGIKFTGDWAKAAKTFGVLKRDFNAKLKVAIKQEAHFFEAKIKEYMSDAGNFVPLSPATLAMRKLAGFAGEKPLNASGALKGAVTVVPNTPALKHFVGILRTARSSKGGKASRSLINVAHIMENGATIVMRMTPAMRRFLFGVLFKGQPKTGKQPVHKGLLIIKIPARPFVSPVFEKYGPTSAKRIQARLVKLFDGQLGKP